MKIQNNIISQFHMLKKDAGDRSTLFSNGENRLFNIYNKAF